jgi:hypothetical protein
LVAIVPNDIELISNDIFSEMVLVLNFSRKDVRNSTIAALTELFSLHRDFMTAVFLPAFFKLNTEGRRTAIAFLKSTEGIEMIITDYGPLIMNLLLDKSDAFPEAAKLIIKRYFLLPGAMRAAAEMAAQLPPAQKSLVLVRLPAFDSYVSILQSEPANEQRQQREQFVRSS